MEDAADDYIKLEDEERNVMPPAAANDEQEKPVLVKLEDEDEVEEPVLLKLEEDEKAAFVKLEADAGAENDVKPKIEPASEPAWMTSKATKIRDACAAKDISQLQELALSEGGLLTDELRQAACE